jgi:hypothetical protein
MPASLRDQIRTWFRAIQPAVFTHWNAIFPPVRPSNTALQQTAFGARDRRYFEVIPCARLGRS